jgi:hypothetical protein
MTNKNIKRAITELVFLHGPVTKNSIIGLLQEESGVVNRTSGSIASLLSKNTQVIRVGTVREPNQLGKRISTPQYDVDRKIILEAIDLVYTMPTALMSPKELQLATQCPCCLKIRIIPSEMENCLSCERMGL